MAREPSHAAAADPFRLLLIIRTVDSEAVVGQEQADAFLQVFQGRSVRIAAELLLQEFQHHVVGQALGESRLVIVRS